ncbi:prepilin-type N-terminal cleavage/methylation domain-containing protein [Mucilaginibacter gracilis]|uniref:Prepilin-type N-terminal cleavage/methylation domain-containing protein n=1 Tax=Mucilaginibacter gracilis TaxID=423350 RepID=A0A495J641_9SPHI|nr:prepilin-type N-terminal cleavage/methylation domain-containing protein [Mucilaginibacter gracilis]RKR84466.1 prepilin-type N-terminal cleavage/methylation domain-containing protein [Mucilaginibacter gracilis]
MMPGKPNTVKAFTLLEMTIAMLVAAVVIGITYTSYQIISRSYLDFKLRNERMVTLASLDQLLRRDFDQAEIISGSNKHIRIDKENKPAVEYEFADRYIIRKAIIIDTFKVTNDSCRMFFEKQQIINDETTETANTEDNRIDELLFNVSYNNETIPYHYNKDYSSENLIKRNPNAVN